MNMRFAIQCVLAQHTDEQRIALRPQHLQYIATHQDQIFCGGPTVDTSGNPEMMLIILDAPDLSSAEAFMTAEPYNQAGVFAQVTIREWHQIIPEPQPGALLQEIDRIASVYPNR
jgi:uncharacterized protein YciI